MRHLRRPQRYLRRPQIYLRTPQNVSAAQRRPLWVAYQPKCLWATAPVSKILRNTFVILLVRNNNKSFVHFSDNVTSIVWSAITIKPFRPPLISLLNIGKIVKSTATFLGKLLYKKKGKKTDIVRTLGPHFWVIWGSGNFLPGPQITQKWTLDTRIWMLCLKVGLVRTPFTIFTPQYLPVPRITFVWRPRARLPNPPVSHWGTWLEDPPRSKNVLIFYRVF